MNKVESSDPSAAAQTTPSRRAHIVTIRRAGGIEGYQLRVGSGGPGQTRMFSVNKLGSERKALAAARAEAQAAGLQLGAGRGGSPQGRRTRRSPTPAAGVRFEWHSFADSVVLYVAASWSDKTGRQRCARYSVERNGLQGALDKAIAARVSCGAPAPDRKALLGALRAERSSRA